MSKKAKSDDQVKPESAQRAADRAMRDDLARSDLTPEDLRARALAPKRLGEVLARLKQLPKSLDFCATLFPYFDLDGAQIADHAALRFHAPMRELEGAGLAKYFTFDPRGDRYAYTPPHFYLALTLFGGWRGIASDVSQPIIFTEGQKKAALACKFELATIGLEGVNNFVRQGDRQPFGAKRGRPASVALDDFDLFDWLRRGVVICYDADVDFKPGVEDAARKLAALLMKRGAIPYFVRLDCKCKEPCKGLDDFLKAHGKAAFDALAREPFDQTALVSTLYVKLRKPSASIFDRKLHQVIAHAKFPVDADYLKTLNAKGQPVSAARVWSTTTKPASRLIFDPQGAPESFIQDPLFPTETGFNNFRSPFCTPKRGDLGLYGELLARLFPDKALRRLFEQWTAYPLQNPGAKLKYAVLLVGGKGMGKTALGLIIGSLYGEYFRHIDQPERLHDRFNGLFENKLFVLGDELVRNRVEAERLKSQITSSRIEIERKGVDTYAAENHANFYLTTNFPDAIKISERDRRWFVNAFPDWGSLDERAQFFTRLGAWYFADGREGAPRSEALEALLYHFLNEVDCADFNPNADAPATEGKRKMAELTEDEAETFARELAEDPKEVLRDSYRYAVPFAVVFNAFLLRTRGNAMAREGDQRALRRALLNRRFESGLYQSRKLKGVVREGVRLVIIDTAWRKGKKDYEIHNYAAKNPLAAEKAPYVASDEVNKSGKKVVQGRFGGTRK
jgi:hypothetical protein